MQRKGKVFKAFLLMFRLGLGLKIRFIAVSMVSLSAILVKIPATSQETRTFLERFASLVGETKEKVSLQEQSLGTKGESRSQRKRAIL